MIQLLYLIIAITITTFIITGYSTLQIIIVQGINTSNMHRLKVLSIVNIITTLVLIVWLVWSLL
jgi:hypothetical protein